ncbi:MAG: GntR family transcriptional regulator [Candidatus Aminicenantales bacterium]
MKKEIRLRKYVIPKTLSESIYNYLKESIIKNELKATQKINEKEIANLFGVSITPVREAVLRLGAEGFVSIDSHREAVVREISFKEIKEIFQVLAILDSLGTSMVIDKLSPEDLKEIEEMTERMSESCSLDSIEEYMALNIELHKRIWEQIPNTFLQSTLFYVNDQMLRYNYARSYAFQKPGVLERSMEEHKEILSALKNKDRKRIKNLLLKHWGTFLHPSPFEEGLKEYLSNEGKKIGVKKS